MADRGIWETTRVDQFEFYRLRLSIPESFFNIIQYSIIVVTIFKSIINKPYA